MLKRIIVGVMVLAWFVTPIYVHPLAVAAVFIQMSMIIISEVLNIQHKAFENVILQYLYMALAASLYYFILPRWGFLERPIVERSGFSAKQNPNFFYWLYEKNL